MKKVLLISLIIMISLFFISCQNEIETKNVDKDETELSDIPAEEWDIEKKKYLSFTITRAKEIFFIEEANGSQTISAFFVDKDGEMYNTDIIWSTNIPNSTSLVKTSTSFSFSVNSIGKLGDYYVTAEANGAKKTYTFSLTTRALLDTCLSYSFVNMLSIIQSGVDLSKEIIDYEDKKEFDLSGIEITSANERMMIESQIEYSASGYNALLISVKEGVYLGKLNYEVVQGEPEYIAMNKNNQILMYTLPKEEPLIIKVKLGEKQEKTITIYTDKPEDYTLAKPIIYDSTAAINHEGRVFSVVGDNVSNNTFPLEDDSTLVLRVERRKLGSDKEFVAYNYKNNEETKDIAYGYSIHLKHAGEYRVQASVLTRAGKESLTVEKTFIVEPYPYENPFSLSFHAKEIIKTENKWAEYPKDEFASNDNQRSNYYHLEIKNPTSEKMYVYSHCKVEDSQESIYYQNLTEKFTIEGNGEWSSDFHCSGSYYFITSISAPGSGYGLEYADEITSYTSEIFDILDCPNNWNKLISVEFSTDESKKLRIKPIIEIPNNATLYVAEYRDNALYDVYSLSSKIELSTAGGEDFSFKAYLYYNDNHKGSPVSFYDGGKALQATSYVISSQSIQRYENQRTAAIYVTKNDLGQYRDTYYSFNKTSWTKINPSEIHGDNFYYFEPLKNSASSKTIYVKTVATNEQAIGYTISPGYTVKLTKLSADCVGCKIESPLSLLIFLLLESIDHMAWINEKDVIGHWSTLSGETGITTSEDVNNVVLSEAKFIGSEKLYEIYCYGSKKGYLNSNTISDSWNSASL